MSVAAVCKNLVIEFLLDLGYGIQKEAFLCGIIVTYVESFSLTTKR